MTQINNDNELHELASAESYCAQEKIREIREIRGRKER